MPLPLAAWQFVDGFPNLLWCARDVDVAHTYMGNGIKHRIVHCRGSTNRA